MFSVDRAMVGSGRGPVVGVLVVVGAVDVPELAGEELAELGERRDAVRTGGAEGGELTREVGQLDVQRSRTDDVGPLVLAFWHVPGEHSKEQGRGVRPDMRGRTVVDVLPAREGP